MTHTLKHCAINAKLQPNDLVEFLSMYVKPKSESKTTREFSRASRAGSPNNARYIAQKYNDTRKTDSVLRCHFCGKLGHKRSDCESAKRRRLDADSGSNNSDALQSSSLTRTCTFCKKNGHTVENCFAKQRSAE